MNHINRYMIESTYYQYSASILLSLCVCFITLLFTPISQALSPVTFVFRFHEQAKVLYNSTSEPENYIIALNKYKKTNNFWAPKKSHRSKGILVSHTLELPRSHTTKEAYQFYVDQLPEQAQELYSCQRRQCGESNNWANKHFEIKQLYGLDNDQYYGVWQWQYADKQQTEYAIVYTVRRGNGRLYTQLELFTSSVANNNNNLINDSRQ